MIMARRELKLGIDAKANIDKKARIKKEPTRKPAPRKESFRCVEYLVTRCPAYIKKE